LGGSSPLHARSGSTSATQSFVVTARTCATRVQMASKPGPVSRDLDSAAVEPSREARDTARRGESRISRRVGLACRRRGVLLHWLQGRRARRIGRVPQRVHDHRGVPGALTCERGVCTRACTADPECTDLRSSATCSPSSGVPACGAGAPPSVCVVACTSDAECESSETASEALASSRAPRTGESTAEWTQTWERGASNSGPVTCSPSAWFCDPSGASTHYCNATGDPTQS
jgi:hypothetical protein